MKKNKTLPYIYFVAFLIALSLLTFTTVAGARATLSDESDVQTTEMQMYSINVAIEEGSEDEDTWTVIASEAGGTGTVSGLSSEMTVGEVYKDDFRVKNNGTIDEYIRVVVYKYWTTDGKTKDYTCDADLIKLVYPDNSSWLEDKINSTKEKEILIYSKILAVGESSDVFLNGIVLDGDIKKDYTLTEKKETVEDGVTYYEYTYDYSYNGKQLKIEIEADGVQTHHAEDAIKSAWGRNVSISSDGTLGLK